MGSKASPPASYIKRNVYVRPSIRNINHMCSANNICSANHTYYANHVFNQHICSANHTPSKTHAQQAMPICGSNWRMPTPSHSKDAYHCRYTSAKARDHTRQRVQSELTVTPFMVKIGGKKKSTETIATINMVPRFSRATGIHTGRHLLLEGIFMNGAI